MSLAPEPPEHVEGTAGRTAPVAERMQVLLSRAVEDQLTEQRQLTQLVADVRAAVDAIPGALREGVGEQRTHAAVEQVQAGLGGIERRLEQLSAAVDRPVDHGPVLERVEALGRRLAAVESRLDKLSELERRIGEVAATGGEAVQAGREAAEAGRAAADAGRAATGAAREAATSGQQARAAAERAAATGREGVALVQQHVDDAVLALAEALVRHRGAAERPGATHAPHSDIAPGELAGATLPSLRTFGEPAPAPDAPARPADPAPSPPARPAVAGPSAPAQPDDVAAVDEPAVPAAPTPPVAAPAPAVPGDGSGAAAALAELNAIESGEPDEPPRHKPWWKPGD